MASLSTIASDIAHYDGYALQSYLLVNIDLIGYIASFYLVMVGRGSHIFSWIYRQKAHATSERQLAQHLSHLYTLTFVFHLAMTVVSAACVAWLAPTLIAAIRARGLYASACVWDDSLVYTGPGGVVMSVVTLSKVAELLTTVSYKLRDFLLEKNSSVSTAALKEALVQTHNTITPPHWWYYVLVALFFWHTYSVGVSTFPLICLANASLRAISNAAMTVEDLSLRAKLGAVIHADGKNKGQAAAIAKRSPVMKALGVLPGLSMLLECVVCISITVYGSYMAYTAVDGCNIIQANSRMCVALYLVALVLAFVQLSNQKNARKTHSYESSEKKKQ